MGFVIDKNGEYLPVFGEASGGGGSITVDSALSDSSTNPVQNKVINDALGDKADTDFSNISNTAKEVISTNAMPSATYDLVQAGASGTWYTAPGNGWYFVNFSTGSGGGDYSRVDWEDGMWLAKNIAGASMNVSWMIPVRKGVKIKLTYGSNAGISGFRFYYC